MLDVDEADEEEAQFQALLKQQQRSQTMAGQLQTFCYTLKFNLSSDLSSGLVYSFIKL